MKSPEFAIGHVVGWSKQGIDFFCRNPHYNYMTTDLFLIVDMRKTTIREGKGYVLKIQILDYKTMEPIGQIRDFHENYFKLSPSYALSLI